MNTTEWLIPSSAEELLKTIQTVINQGHYRPGEERVAIYSRVSVIDPHATSYSMEIQPDSAEQYAQSKGWRVVGIYSDPDRTGRNSRRPDLQRMIQDIIAGSITIVIVHRLDRLYRNLEALLRFLKLLERYNVRLISVTEQIDTETPMGRLILYVMGGMAEMYVRSASERTQAKLKRIEAGLSNASTRFGYCNGLCSECTDPNGPGYCPLAGDSDRGKGRIPLPHPIESHAVRLIAILYSQGMSNSDIADYLNTHDFTLPDGQVTHFRTKGRPGVFPPGEFKRDSVRDIVRNPFYAGLVVSYPSKPLDMEDDPEHPDKRAPKPKDATSNRRVPKKWKKGQHQALYSVQLWQHNQQLRQNKSFTPASQRRPRREYLLTGIGRCWVCAQYDGREANLRGVTGGSKGREYYRCATVHDNYRQRGKKAPEAFEAVLPAVGLTAQANGDNLLDLHQKSSLQAGAMGEQITTMVNKLAIPEEWYDHIMAYYLTDEGLSHFEREGYNLRQELGRLQVLFERGHLTLAQFEQRSSSILRQLQRLQPSAQPGAGEIVPLLKDFTSIWEQLSTGGQRGLLKVMFAGLYFDSDSRLRRALAHEPFSELLGLPPNGMIEQA